MDEIEDSMAMELSGFAWDYLNDVAKEEQNDERNIFGKLNELGRHIKSKRESIKKIKNNGGFDGTAKRQKLLDLADKAFQESRRIRQYTDEMTSLMNRGSVTISTILRDIPVITGKTLDSDSEELINQLLQSYTGTFENNSDALGVISQYLKQACSISRDRIGRRESELTEDKNTLLRQMRQSCKTGQLDDYKDLALSLYESPAYKAGESLVLLGDSLLEIPSYSPSGYLNNLNSYGITLAALYKERMEAVKQTGYREMQLDMEDFIQRKENWRTRFQEQLDDGMAQWKRSTERMIGLRERWRQQFLREYRYKDKLWQIRLEDFYSSKREWIDDCSLSAFKAGSDYMADKFGLEADRLINDSRYFLIPSVGSPAPEVSQILSDAMEEKP